MTSLEELQNRYLDALSSSRAAADDAETELWKQIGESLLTLIAFRMERDEEGHPEWSSNWSQGTLIAEPLSVECGQQVLRTPFGYVGAGRWALTLGAAAPLKSHDKSMLRAALDAYLDRNHAPDAFREACQPLLRD